MSDSDDGLVKLSVMVTPELRDRLKHLADKEDRTIGKHVARVLRDYADQHVAKVPAP